MSETWTGEELGSGEPPEVQPGQVESPASGEEQLPASVTGKSDLIGSS